MPDRTPREGGPLAESVDLSELPHDSIGQAVVSVVAAYTGRAIQDLDSLVETVDPDALEALCREDGPGAPEQLQVVQFEYQGLVVSISQCSQLRIRPIEHRERDDGSRYRR